jgi:predicted alpha/beta superfamily hydrolase
MRLALAFLLVAACHAAPSPAPAPAPAPAEAVLPHETFTMESAALHETRRVNVYLPPGYGDDPTTRYAILYMPDGGVAEDFPHVTRTVDTLIRAGKMRPTIVVGIENTERRRDMTGRTAVAKDREIAPHVGGSAAFRAFLRDELVPEIGRRVRGSGETAIMGESLAGLFVVETFLYEPRLFDHYIAFSPSLWWNGQGLVRATPEYLALLPADHPVSLYLAHAGDDDVDASTSGFAAAVKTAAPATLAFTFAPMPEEKHATIYRAAEGLALPVALPPVGH